MTRPEISMLFAFSQSLLCDARMVTNTLHVLKNENKNIYIPISCYF